MRLELDEQRSYCPVLDLRAVPELPRRLIGTVIVFNSMSEDVGGFREVIAPEAVARTLREKIDLRALVDHDTGRVLGRLSAGTLRLSVTPRGLQAEIDVPETSFGDDTLESVRRRDLTGMSFAFRSVVPPTWEEVDGKPVATVHDMRMREVSVVAFPAYTETDIAVAKRALAAWQASRPWHPSLAFQRRRQQLAAAR